MRFALPSFALLIAVSTTSATLLSRQSLPNCAVPCLVNANTGNCTPGDDSCLCTNQAFINSTTTCIESSCSGSDLQNAEAYAQQLCLAVGVTLTATPTGSPSHTSAASSSPTASPSSTASSSSGAPMTSSISVFTGAMVALAIAAVL